MKNNELALSYRLKAEKIKEGQVINMAGDIDKIIYNFQKYTSLTPSYYRSGNGLYYLFLKTI